MLMDWMWRLLPAAAVAMPCVSALPADAGEVSARRLLEVVDIGSPTLSPDGRSVAFRIEQASLERNAWDTTWYVQGLHEALPRRVADGGVPLRDSAGQVLPARVAWSPDGRWIYYRALHDARIAVWRAAADGSLAQAVTDDAADVREFAISADGRGLRYSVGATREAVHAAEQAEYERGIHVDERVPLGQALFRSGRVDGRAATQRFGGTWFDRAPLLADVADRWMEVDLVTGVTRRAADAPSPTTHAAAGDEGEAPWKWADDPRTGYTAMLTRVGDGTGKMFRPDVRLSVRRVGRVEHCTAEACRDAPITSLQWRPGHDEVLFTTTDHDLGLAQAIHRWNVVDGTTQQVVETDGLVSGGRDASSACGMSADTLVCVTAEADRPPRLERIDIESGARHVLFDPNAALAQDLARSGPARLLRWSDRAGRTHTGRLFPARTAATYNRAGRDAVDPADTAVAIEASPAGSRDGRGVRGDDRMPPRTSASVARESNDAQTIASARRPSPLFVTYYSCPGFLRGGVGDEWPLAALAEAGIAALCINQQPGYTLDAVERHGEGLAAVESVIDLLASQGEIDRTRVGMGGLSFGGAVTMWTATESRLLAAASIANPVVSPTYYLLASMKGERFLTGLRDMWGLGAPEETPERWRALSPVFKLDRIHAPILFQHAEQEYLYAMDYVIPLLRRQQADLYVYPDEPHQKFQPRHKLAAYERNLDWFRFWLQGVEDPVPNKQDQYARWRQMRERRDLGR